MADEILDVNERKLEDLSRTEVIRHIHEVGIILQSSLTSAKLIIFSHFPVHPVLHDKVAGEAKERLTTR